MLGFISSDIYLDNVTAIDFGAKGNFMNFIDMNNATVNNLYLENGSISWAFLMFIERAFLNEFRNFTAININQGVARIFKSTVGTFDNLYMESIVTEAIRIEQSDTGIIDGAIFKSSGSSDYNTGPFFSWDSNSTIINAHFSDCTGEYGGAIRFR